MIILILAVLGLCLGSFVNALVWRVHEQDNESAKHKPDKKYLKKLSLSRGRSICTNCKHELKAKDLVPVYSWLSLRGKCRYCHNPIPVQYPIVELSTAVLFTGSYIFWPEAVKAGEIVVFGVWLALLTGFIALVVYDLRWMLLPNRVVYPLCYIASSFALFEILMANNPGPALLNTLAAVAVGGGLFYIIFQVSDGKWIGGGDVKLGWLLGLIAGTPARSLLLIFAAALMGSIVSLFLISLNQLKSKSVIPFGPFLIVGAVIVQLFGNSLMHWYLQTFLNI